MKNIYNCLVFLLSILFFLVIGGSCKKASPFDNNGNGGSSSPTFDFYACGVERIIISIQSAVYWAKGQKTVLAGDAEATSIVVSNNDIYVGGYVGSGARVAHIWKNGSSIFSTDPSEFAEIHAIAINGSDIYAAGHKWLPFTPFIATVWKNGVATSLGSGARVFAIAVSNNDVYAAGYQEQGYKKVAKIWKNGIGTNITDGTQNSILTGIAISGTDVYVSGFEENTLGTNIAKYWANGVPVVLSDGRFHGYANGICVSGNDVYVTGANQYPAPTYSQMAVWKNGVLISMPTTLGTHGNSISVINGNVFVGGEENTLAAYWINNSMHNYTTITMGSVNSIFVVQR